MIPSMLHTQFEFSTSKKYKMSAYLLIKPFLHWKYTGIIKVKCPA